MIDRNALTVQMDDSNVVKTRPDTMQLLQPYRERLDALDDQIVDLLVQRFAVIREVAELKAARGIPSVLPARVTEVLDRNAATAEAKGLDPAVVRQVYTYLIKHAHDIEDQAKHAAADG